MLMIIETIIIIIIIVIMLSEIIMLMVSWLSILSYAILYHAVVGGVDRFVAAITFTVENIINSCKKKAFYHHQQSSPIVV